MFPFHPPFPNQNHYQANNDSSLSNPSQFPTSSTAPPNQFPFNNPHTLMPSMGNFNNPSALFGTLLAQQQLMQGLQNNLMGALLQQGMMPQLHGQPQLNLLGALQAPNFMPLQQGGLLGRPPVGQNMNQMMGLRPNGLLRPQNPIFPPNSQLPVVRPGNSYPGFLGNGSAHEIASQKLEEPILPGLAQNNKSGGRQWSQMTHGQAGGKNFSSNSSENVASNNFKPKFNEQGKREPSHMRFQKSQSDNSRNAWQKEKRFPRNNQRGQRQKNGRITVFSPISDNIPTIRKRPLSVVYSESEIQQWREARKKNFPSRTNIEKKLSLGSAEKEDMDSYGKVRRQELKQVLAKQAELGVEVAEIPSIYLTEPEEQTGEALNTNIETSCKSFKNNKRGRFRSNKRNSKRLKFRNETSTAHEQVVKKREPTLLRKLLSADIRRDRSQLLQAFRFMVLNSFFKGVPDKPLVFPIITTKDVEPGSEVVVEKKPVQNKVDYEANFTVKNERSVEVEREKYSTDEDDEIDDGASDVICETNGEDLVLHGGEKSEEGEITD